MADVPDGRADPVTAALADVLRDYGRRITTDPVRLRAALNDVLGSTAQQHRAAVDALVVSVQEDVPSALGEGGTGSSDDAVARLAAWGLDASTAAWVAEAWLAVLPGHFPASGASPTAQPPTVQPADAQPPTAQPATVEPGLQGAAPVAGPVAGPVAAPVAGPTAGPVAAPSLLARAARHRGLTGAAAAALLAVVAGTAYAVTSSDGQPLARPSGGSTPSLTSSGISTLTTTGAGPSGAGGTPSATVSVSVQATILSTPTAAGTKQPGATRTPARTPTARPKPTPKLTPRSQPAPRPIAATTGVVYSVAQQTTSSVWNSTVWHASIARYITNPWTRMTPADYYVYSPNRGGYVTAAQWAQVQQYGADGFAWHPLKNGPMTIYIHFYVYNSAGLKSNEGMLTVNISCQANATVGCST